MAIELTEEPLEPVLPAGLVVDELRDDEYAAFYAALNKPFVYERVGMAVDSCGVAFEKPNA